MLKITYLKAQTYIEKKKKKKKNLNKNLNKNLFFNYSYYIKTAVNIKQVLVFKFSCYYFFFKN